MNPGLGAGLIAAGVLLGLLIVFPLRHRVPPAPATAVLAACGMLVGSGALLVQDDASATEWAFTLVALGVLTPLHARILFGRPRPSR